ncbi:conjugative transfer system coupling protein TraD [Burkholderia sp. Ac-20365]|uniref:conjugative transfer system coupling protein TraD n=1 Tax=Burkholderia sp. Ac-20365 TaxID=2703897 RepID=UPI00197B2E95|nr:conjugative transfer system coupling protein TraD [Burkholderia sp. Ac-20365]MBN3761051.1 conjugative transfer system coupling protein TraD [Burkholderia sp. Ac-20365]
MRSYSDMFRPNYDVGAAAMWLAGVGSLAATRPPFWEVPALASGVMVFCRAKLAADLYRFRLSLSGYRVEVKTLPDTLKESHAMYERGMLFLGNGYRWEQYHSEVATKIMRRSSSEIPGVPAWLPKGVVKRLTPQHWTPVKDTAVGVPWIHGIEPDDAPIGIPFDALEGHTLIAGTTRAGKTRLYELIITQLIYQKRTVFIIDPKGDKDLEKRCREECKRAGRKFLFFHPSRPSESIRLDPLANWTNIANIATRVGQLVNADDSFKSFAWKTLYTIMRGMVAAGQRPNIQSVKRYAQLGVETLLDTVIGIWMPKNHKGGHKWDEDVKSHMSQKDPREIVAKIALYKKLTIETGAKDEVIDSLIAMVEHSKEHYSKMIQVLEPILEMLGSDEVGKMLSPDPTDLDDERPIYDTRKIIEENCVCYIALDSLSDATIGSAIGSIILADLANVCGHIYNFEKGKKDVFLFVDEASEALNDQLIQILNKGGGAGMKCFIATQTKADFAARLGSEDKARQVLGNLNNVISLRLKDYETAQWIAESFGKTAFREVKESMNSGMGSVAHPTEFNASSGRSLDEKEAAFVSADLLTRLPPFNFFAFIGGSTLYKGRFPIIN